MDIRTSPLVLGAYEARRKTQWILAWVVAFLVGIIVVSGLVGALLEPLLGSATDGSVKNQYVELFTNGVTILVVFAWVKFYEKRAISSIGFRGDRGVAKFLAGMLAGILLFSVPVLALWLTGQYSSFGSVHTSLGMAALGGVIAVVPVWVIQGSSEEIVTRGFLLQNNATQLPSWAALALVSVGFSVAHLNFTPLVLLNTVLIGLAFAFICLGQGSLWIAMGLHVGWNFAQGNVFGIPVSGHAKEVSLWAFGPEPGTSAFLTGGDYGVEASLYATIVIAILTWFTYRYYRRTEAQRPATPVPTPEYDKGSGESTAVESPAA